MSKRIFIFLLGVIFLFPLRFVHAGLVINEIMYDLSGSDSASSKSREWVEVYNPESHSIFIDASKWRFYDGSANRTINDQANFSIPAGAYIIWAGDKDTFLSDHAGFSGTVYETGISSLNNTGATLKILDQDGTPVATVTYASSQGGAGDGNSLQKISGAWVGGVPTAGVGNGSTSSNTNNDTSTSTSDSSNNTETIGGPVLSDSTPAPQDTQVKESKTKTPSKTLDQKIKTAIVAKTTGLAGVPVNFQITTTGSKGQQVSSGRYFLNFGDGDSKEVQVTATSTSLSHTYSYPGDYVVNLEYYVNSYANTPDATDKATVKIVSADLSISAVGTQQDFFVEVTNNTSYDADVSNWVLASATKNFTFPKNSIIDSKKKLSISPALTGFSISDRDTLKLIAPQGKIIFEYQAPAPKVVTLVTTPNTTIKIVKKVSKNEDMPETTSEIVNNEPEVAVETLPVLDQPATPILSGIFSSGSDFPYAPIILSIVVGFGAGAAYLIRLKKRVPKGRDFEILDE